MAKIKIKDIKLTGADLFDDSESFMNELSNDELDQAMGGGLVRVESVQFSCNCCPTTGGIKIRTLTYDYPCSPVIL
ncbi:hypothetical protein [Moorena sp. SIO3H5]|uniref:hypothetical protein n=1 Tax=Moorena sp. SIO3H5 TaxID=2607834 RepID=UPI0013BB736F|nr:hypothetical protein [Moorena sp. SIO3H5]NEO68976.1 hypothetical protein [Moorena sp. SIO3H5]